MEKECVAFSHDWPLEKGFINYNIFTTLFPSHPEIFSPFAVRHIFWKRGRWKAWEHISAFLLSPTRLLSHFLSLVFRIQSLFPIIENERGRTEEHFLFMSKSLLRSCCRFQPSYFRLAEGKRRRQGANIPLLCILSISGGKKGLGEEAPSFMKIELGDGRWQLTPITHREDRRRRSGNMARRCWLRK